MLPEPHSSAAMGGPQSIDLTPKGKGGTCHCQRFFQSLVVVLRPTESDYCRVPKLALTERLKEHTEQRKTLKEKLRSFKRHADGTA